MKPLAFFSFLLLAFTAVDLHPVPAAETREDLQKKARAALATIEGSLTIPGLKEPVEVLRDRWGIAHIYAKNTHDLFFAQGFVAAQDRLFQIDMWRRTARGETAEVIGKAGLEGDHFARLINYRGNLDKEWASYGPEAKAIAHSFTSGINACIEQMGDRLPVEFQLLGIKPGKWAPEDILGRMSGIIMTRNWRQEVQRAALIEAVGLEKARQLAPTDPTRAFAPAPGLSLKGLDQTIFKGYDAATKVLPFEAAQSGSNNWVISSALSTSGKPLLASDPHRSIALPSLRYLVHLNAPGWNVIGAGEPGLPGVAIGHNERVAWGFTIIGTDQADLYVVETKPDDPTQYKLGSRWEPMTTITQEAKVRGEKNLVELTMRYTEYGPIVHQDAKQHRAFALRWVGSEPGSAAYLNSLRLDQVKSGKEFVQALGHWKVPALNMVYADVEGDIGWVAAGLTPIRKGWDGLLPVPADGKFQWQGFRSLDQLPQVANPKVGYVATANHNIVPADYPHEIGYEFTPSYRFRQIQRRLDAKKKFDLDDFASIQHDNTTIAGETLVRLAKEVDMKSADLNPHADMLAKWDAVLTRQTPAGPLYAIWMQELLDAFYRPHVPANLMDFFTGGRGIEVMVNALEKPDKTWFGADPVAGRDSLLRKTFATAVTRLKKLQGDDPKQWSWGRLHTTTFRHPLAGLGDAHAKSFSLGPVPRPGDGLTPNAATHDAAFKHTNGATYRHILDLSDWDKGMATSAPGQSGQPGSPHYSDLLPLWENGDYFPLAYSRARVEQVMRHKLQLVPAKK